MITNEQVKDYLRIPIEDMSEDVFLDTIIQLGYDYLKDAMDDFQDIYESNETFKRKADYWVLTMWCPMAYDEREGMTAGGENLGYTARSLLMQLQMYRKGGE